MTNAGPGCVCQPLDLPGRRTVFVITSSLGASESILNALVEKWNAPINACDGAGTRVGVACASGGVAVDACAAATAPHPPQAIATPNAASSGTPVSFGIRGRVVPASMVPCGAMSLPPSPRSASGTAMGSAVRQRRYGGTDRGISVELPAGVPVQY